MKLSHVVAAALIAGCVLCAPAGASAQESEQPPDVSITARVTAQELLFRKVPNPRVEFTGRPARETVWDSERQNLPAEVQPGVTYRDIGITLRITSVFPDIERIVAEALGEIPASDDAPPAPESTPPAPAGSPDAAPSPSSADTNPTPRRRPRTTRRGRGK